MLDKRTKEYKNMMIESGAKEAVLEKRVWMCISCTRREISRAQPTICACHKPQWVLETGFVVVQ